MTGPAFLSVDLVFGRHAGRHDLDDDQPVLIVGANGSGKSTLLDALLRTIYGFRRRATDERELSQAREPWGRERYCCTARIRTADGETLAWERDHVTDEVLVVREADDEVLFRGSANPGSKAAADRDYWDLVERTFGLRHLEDYARTAWVGQGAVLETTFGTDLLRLAEGGHARLQSALGRIKDRHKDLTREPISDDARRGPVDRRVERDRRALAEARRHLAEARGASTEHDRAEQRLEEVDAEAAGLATDIERLETARTALAERRRLDAEIDAADQRLDHLVELREAVDAARREVRDAERECEGRRPSFRAYPSDFPDDAERLEEAWKDEARLRTDVASAESELELLGDRPGDRVLPALAGVAAFATVGAGFAAASGAASGPGAVAAWVAAAILASLTGLAVLGLVRAAERRGTRRGTVGRLDAARRKLEDARTRAERLLDGMPETVARDLSPESLPERRAGYERSRAAFERREEAKQKYREAVRRVEQSPEARSAPGRSLPLLVSDAQRRRAEIRVRREKLDSVSDTVAEDLPLTVRGLDERLRERRARREDLQREREELRIRLDRAARRLADAARFEREVGELERRVDEAEDSARALRAAHALLRDGYERFRDHDEARLVAAVSGRLDRLGEPSLGPFRAENGLAVPTVQLEGRRLSIDSRALSHGQRRLVMLAIRLGAADFLADGGPAAPLIVDEPFAHLDDRHAAQVWNLLQDIAVHRQVVVTTQEADLLDRLDARPTIRLS